MNGNVYRVEFTSRATDDLDHMDKPIAQRILKKLRWLAENLDSISPETLTGEWRGFYKLRIGDYRAIYSIGQAEVIIVHFIGHRREVYKL